MTLNHKIFITLQVVINLVLINQVKPCRIEWFLNLDETPIKMTEKSEKPCPNFTRDSFYEENSNYKSEPNQSKLNKNTSKSQNEKSTECLTLHLTLMKNSKK